MPALVPVDASSARLKERNHDSGDNGFNRRIAFVMPSGYDAGMTMVQEHEKNQASRVLSFRAPMIVLRQLAALRSRWGESITHVLHRAIAQAYEREFGSND